jgi:hypothetical protein
VLGEEAIGAVREKLEAQRRELETWTDLGLSTAMA